MEMESVAGMHARKIQEDLLNLKCPRCLAVFVSFDGCFAVKCHRCQCGFCAWCLQDCGKDAHGHVVRCPHRRSEEVYYGDFDQFEACHRSRKARLVHSYLKDIPAQAKQVVKMCEVSLREIGFDIAKYL
jgi:hypothetical protein